MSIEQVEAKMSGRELAEFMVKYLPEVCVVPVDGVPVFGPAFVRLSYREIDGYVYPDVLCVPKGWGLVVWEIDGELEWGELNPKNVATLRGMTPEVAMAQLRVWGDEWAHLSPPTQLRHIRAYHQWRDVWYAVVRTAEARNGHKPQP
jgi:hypothetical protein